MFFKHSLNLIFEPENFIIIKIEKWINKKIKNIGVTKLNISNFEIKINNSE